MVNSGMSILMLQSSGFSELLDDYEDDPDDQDSWNNYSCNVGTLTLNGSYNFNIQQ